MLHHWGPNLACYENPVTLQCNRQSRGTEGVEYALRGRWPASGKERMRPLRITDRSSCCSAKFNTRQARALATDGVRGRIAPARTRFSEHPGFQARGLGHHALVPGWVEDQLHVRLGDGGHAFDLRAHVLDQ